MRKVHLWIWSFIILTVVCSMSYSYYYKFYNKEKAEPREIPSSLEKNTNINIPKYIDIPSKEQEVVLQEEEEEKRLKSVKEYRNGRLHNKEVFLTFDDGPSNNNTEKVLNILKENNIKASFFVIGKRAEEKPELIRELNKNGMCIIPHSYTHDYKIYKSYENYMNDFAKCRDTIKKITGADPVCFVRMPGGSDNKIGKKAQLLRIKKGIMENGFSYIDWNVSSADAAMDTVPTYMIRDNVIRQCRYTKFAVVLMHDAQIKTTSAEALPEIVRFLKNQGFVFRTFNDITPEEKEEMVKIKIMNR